jgi:hypothetical protein
VDRRLPPQGDGAPAPKERRRADPDGALLIVLGCLILVVEVSSIDAVVWSLSCSEGIHLSDLIGGAAVVAGIVTLWAVLTP